MASTSNGPSRPKGSPKPCVITFFTQNDKMNEPPPQPRVRKVTTVISTLAVVVRNTQFEIGVWVMTSCEERTIPKTPQQMFLSVNLGSWLIVGIYADGSFASISPYRLEVQAYETVVEANVVFLKMRSSDLQYDRTLSFDEFVKNHLRCPANEFTGLDKSTFCAEFHLIHGFGLILAHRTIRAYMYNNSDDYVWIQWTGEATKGCCWSVNSFKKNTNEDGFTEKELRDCADVIRNREISDVGYRATEKGHVARHFGLITDVNEQKKTILCWSNHGAIESDHIARIPQPPKHRDTEGPMLSPYIGQWVQFDIDEKNQDSFMFSKTGTRLSIAEYLPVTSPNGVGVVHAHKAVRILLSCCLIKSTVCPLLFDLGDYGFAIDRNCSLVSGLYMQLVIEKMPARMRKLSGASWKVISSSVVKLADVTVELLTRLTIAEIPNRDAMELSTAAQIPEKSSAAVFVPKQGQQAPPTSMTSSTTSSSGITNLKYQPPQQQLHYQEPSRRDYYSGSNVQMAPMLQQHPNQQDRPSGGGQFPPKRKFLGYINASLEGHALVEKVNSNMMSGILWMFDAKLSVRDPLADLPDVSKASIHFTYNDGELDHLDIGDYAHVKLIQKPDETAKPGFRWKFLGGSKKSPPCKIYVYKNNIVAEDTLVYAGIDKMKRAIFQSNLFPTVLDLQGSIQDPQSVGAVRASLTRKKVPTLVQDKTMFQWVLTNPMHVSYTKSFFVSPAGPPPNGFSRSTRHFSLQPVPSTSDHKKASEHASTSPPLKSSAVLFE